MGNHEIMNCVGDFRYVSPKEFEECGEYFCAKKTQHKSIFPYGYKERKLAFSLWGNYCKKICFYEKVYSSSGRLGLCSWWYYT